MNINFIELQKHHFQLMRKWLSTYHVKKWWGNKEWTDELVAQKYSTYVDGYKFENDRMIDIQAFIIKVDQTSVGYIQIYNPNQAIPNLILRYLDIVAVDMFIGDVLK